MAGWWRWALVSPDGVAPSQMVSVSVSVNLPLHHKVQKFSSGTGWPGWSQKKGHKTVVVVVVSALKSHCFVCCTVYRTGASVETCYDNTNMYIVISHYYYHYTHFEFGAYGWMLWHSDTAGPWASERISGLYNIEWPTAGMVICLEWGANDLHTFQLMPLPPCHLLLH